MNVSVPALSGIPSGYQRAALAKAIADGVLHPTFMDGGLHHRTTAMLTKPYSPAFIDQYVTISGVPNEVAVRYLHQGRLSMRGVPNEVATRLLHHGRYVSVGEPDPDPEPDPDARPGRTAVDFRIVQGPYQPYTRSFIDRFVSIGDVSAAAPVPPSFGAQYMAGLAAWASPRMALSLLPGAFGAFTTAPGAALGILTPPIALAVLVFTMLGGKKR